MEAHIDLKDVSVSYYLRAGKGKMKGGRNSVGGQILVRTGYVEILALRDVNLTFRHGDRVGLIGVNGSGKSTLLKLCAGALSAQKGNVSITGKVVPQFTLGAGIKPSLSGRVNAELKCLYMGIPQSQIADRVELVKETSQLGDFFELPVSSYSAGMRSRLVMSLIGLARGDILIMDEWIGAADVSLNAAVDSLQARMVKAASILILASHSQRVLMEWTQRLIWIDQGVVRADGPTEQVYQYYREATQKP